ncbi:dienelactone hydrolase family protein [Amycolatopsis sp. NPDC004378]
MDWATQQDARASAINVSVPVADGERMPAWRFDPVGRSVGACLVAPDVYGPSPFYAEVAARLANAGYTALLVDFYFREGPLAEATRDAAFARRAGVDELRTLRDLDAAVDVLGARGRSRVGVLGFCLAGQFTLNLCARRTDLAAVCFYAFPEGVQAPAAPAAPRPIDEAGSITGPILSFWGREDYIPLPVIDRFGEAMHEHGVDYTQRIYDGAGHGFLQGLVEKRTDSAAAHDAWARALGFLHRHLAGDTEAGGEGP